MNSMKILISGGHITPALAVIDYVQAKKLPVSFVFLGRLFSQEKLQQRSVEKEEVTKRGVKFISFFAPRMVHQNPIKIIHNGWRFIQSVRQAIEIISQEKPDAFLSFGGYLAVPIALACRWKKVPIITHEQTRTAGMANQLIARVASRVAISHQSSRHFFPEKKVIFTGNPVRRQIMKMKVPKPAWLDWQPKYPLLLVMGGNQGSRIINQTVLQSLSQILEEWTLVHQCGRPTTEDNYLEQLSRARQRLPEEMQKRYFVKEWLSEDELAWFYRHVFGVISRAGANSVLELATLQVPAIFIPLPFAYKNEQWANARWLVEVGGAIVLDQRVFSSESLLIAINEMKQSADMMRKNLKSLNLSQQADKKLYQLVKKVVESSRGEHAFND